jgi:hypothetical protein
MNILRLSTLSLTAAIAVFALGYASPAFAPPPVCPGDHPSCKNDSGDGDGDTDFTVEMKPGSVGGADGLLISDGPCGTTVDQGQRELDASFPALEVDGCVTVGVNFITPPTGGPLTLRALAFQVRSNKSDVLMFFTDGQIIEGHLVPDTAGVYVSERLPATISRNGSITVEVGLSGLNVVKNHQPGKGDLVGPIAIGNIVYTPIE